VTHNCVNKDQIRETFLNKKTFITGPPKSGKSYLTKYIISMINNEFDYLCEIYEHSSDLIDTDAYIYNTISTHPASVIESLIKKSYNVDKLCVLFNVKIPEEYIETVLFSQLMALENITLFFYSTYPVQPTYPRYNVILTKNLDMLSYSTYITTYFNTNKINNIIYDTYFNLKNFEYIVIDRYKQKYYHVLNTPKKDEILDGVSTSSISLYSLIISHRTGSWRTFIPYINENGMSDEMP
jgi:hypothetical protein